MRVGSGPGTSALAAWLSVPWMFAVPAGLAVWWALVRRGARTGKLDRPWRRFVVSVASMTLLTASAWSYVGYLTAPGYASFDVRSADWLRDHGFDPVVDALEHWLYGRHTPGHGPVSLDRLPVLPPPVANGDAPVTGRPAAQPLPIAQLIDASLPGEGQWTPAGLAVNGGPILYTAYFRPDPAATSVLAVAAWIDQEHVETVFVPGTREPSGGPWAWESTVPNSERDRLLAAFNSGFKFKHIPGGVLTEGREPEGLVDGQASLLIDTDGRVHIGAWGADQFVHGDHVASVRQNLALIVADGEAVSGLMESGQGQWGRRKWQLRYTRRSAMGVTATGDLIYVSGNHMTLGVLADALLRAGAVVAMQLDIHEKHPTFNVFQPDASERGTTGAKLDPTNAQSANRYLKADQRDFFVVLVRDPSS